MTHEDNHSLLEWLRGKELEAHLIWCNDCDFLNDCRIDEDEVKTEILCAQDVKEKAFREVINHIENNPKELHRCLIPAGWDYV